MRGLIDVATKVRETMNKETRSSTPLVTWVTCHLGQIFETKHPMIQCLNKFLSCKCTCPAVLAGLLCGTFFPTQPHWLGKVNLLAESCDVRERLQRHTSTFWSDLLGKSAIPNTEWVQGERPKALGKAYERPSQHPCVTRPTN